MNPRACGRTGNRINHEGDAPGHVEIGIGPRNCHIVSVFDLAVGDAEVLVEIDDTHDVKIRGGGNRAAAVPPAICRWAWSSIVIPPAKLLFPAPLAKTTVVGVIAPPAIVNPWLPVICPPMINEPPYCPWAIAAKVVPAAFNATLSAMMRPKLVEVPPADWRVKVCCPY